MASFSPLSKSFVQIQILVFQELVDMYAFDMLRYCSSQNINAIEVDFAYPLHIKSDLTFLSRCTLRPAILSSASDRDDNVKNAAVPIIMRPLTLTNQSMSLTDWSVAVSTRRLQLALWQRYLLILPFPLAIVLTSPAGVLAKSGKCKLLIRPK